MEKLRGHLPFLDYLRGVAIILVFVCHGVLPVLVLTDHPNWMPHDGASDIVLLEKPITLATTVLNQGWAGVALFFVISGFCIHLSHQRSRSKSWREFLVRRFFRIYPPYLVALFFFALILPYSRLHLGTSHHNLHLAISSARSLFSHIFLSHQFGVGPNDINPPFWSIAVEVKLYVMYPILVWLAFRFGWKTTIWITGFLEFGLRTSQVLHLSHVLDSLNTSLYLESPWYFWFSWSIGAWIAEAYLKGEALPFARLPLFLFPVIFVICDVNRQLVPFCFPLAALFSAQVVARLLNPSTVAWGLTGWKRFLSEHVRKTGVVSYSIYLIHYPLQNTFYLFVKSHLPKLFGGTTVCLVGLLFLLLPFWIIIYGLSLLCHHYIEMASIAWGSKIIQRNRTTGDAKHRTVANLRAMIAQAPPR